MMATQQVGSVPRQVPWWAGRAALLAVAVAIAYWLSLGTLWSALGGQTPLAFIGLAPILALGLLLAGLRRREAMPYPGRVDLILGLILIGAAGAIVLTGPTLASVYFWTARLDVVSMPLFASGALVLLFGWRVLFVARGAILLLLMTWPLPYLVLLENTSEAMTRVTSGALTVIAAIIPIATPVPGSDATFTVANAQPFQVQVATACAGLNSTVAFGLVGGAFVLLLRGAWLKKLAWLAVGLTVVFLLNILRVVLLVAVGAMVGEDAALNFFHPIAGTVALTAGLLLMLVLLPRFGLSPPDLRAAPPAAGPLPSRPTVAASRNAVFARVAVLATVAALFGAVNATFAAYGGSDASSVSGRPVIGTLSTLGGWDVKNQHDINIGRPYYGMDSTWTRYQIFPKSDRPADTRYAMWVDSVTANHRQGFVDFGVEKCYRFHGHSIDAAEPVALGRGVVGHVIAVTRTNHMVWVVLWWEWPVEVAGQVRHERVTLLANANANPIATGDGAAASGIILFDIGTAIPDNLKPLASDMTSVASRIVTDHAISTAASK